MRRTGEHSYQIKVDETCIKDAPLVFLKEYKIDDFRTNPLELFYHRRTVVDWETTPEEWIVDKILKHKRDEDGKYTFLTHWHGTDEHDATWEPVNSFIHRYNSELVKYCKEKDLRLDLTKTLSSVPSQG